MRFHGTGWATPLVEGTSRPDMSWRFQLTGSSSACAQAVSRTWSLRRLTTRRASYSIDGITATVSGLQGFRDGSTVKM